MENLKFIQLAPYCFILLITIGCDRNNDPAPSSNTTNPPNNTAAPSYKLLSKFKLNTKNIPFDAVIKDEYLYIATGNLLSSSNADLFIHNLKNPSAPLIDYVYIGLNFQDLNLDGNFMYLTGEGFGQPSGNFTILDITNRTAPKTWGSYKAINDALSTQFLPGSERISKWNQFIFIQHNNTGRILMVDVGGVTNSALPPPYVRFSTGDFSLSGSGFYGAFPYSQTEAVLVDDYSIYPFSWASGALTKLSVIPIPGDISDANVNNQNVLFIVGNEGSKPRFSTCDLKTKTLGSFDLTSIQNTLLYKIDSFENRLVIGGLGSFVVYKISSDLKSLESIFKEEVPLSTFYLVKLTEKYLISGSTLGEIRIYEWK